MKQPKIKLKYVKITKDNKVWLLKVDFILYNIKLIAKYLNLIIIDI